MIHAEHEPPSAAYWQLCRFDALVMTADAPYAEELLSRNPGIQMTDSGSGCSNRSVSEIEKTDFTRRTPNARSDFHILSGIILPLRSAQPHDITLSKNCNRFRILTLDSIQTSLDSRSCNHVRILSPRIFQSIATDGT